MKRLLLLLSLLTVPLYGEDAVEGPSFDYWSEFVNMLVTLGLIIVMVIVSVWVLKKIMRSRSRSLNSSTGIKIMERRALSSKSSLFLVEILGKAVVVSESAAGVQLITELDPSVNIEEHLASQQEDKPSFSEMLQKKLKSMTRRNESA